MKPGRMIGRDGAGSKGGPKKKQKTEVNAMLTKGGSL